MQDNIKLATRESPLALRQANIVKEYLLENNVFNRIDIVAMSTSGDRADNETFKSNGGKGLFLKELENALIEGKAHIAVHSMKDVPAKVNNRFLISSIMEREDPCDVFISNSYKSIEEISNGTIGSSSPRRQAMIKSLGKNINVVEMRGNINTRLKKLKNSNIDGIILAKAGLRRMEMDSLITQNLSVESFVPSPGQGVLCIECLSQHSEIMSKIREICVSAERIFAAQMDGDCMSPIGAHATIQKDLISITGFVATADGTRFIRNKFEGNKNNYKDLSTKLSNLFIKMGSKGMLKC